MKIPQLPSEVIRNILELVDGPRRAHSEALLSVALKSKSFAVEAQAVLWRHITLRSKKMAELFVDSPYTQRALSAGTRKVHSLYMYASNSSAGGDKTRINTATVMAVLDKVPGIRQVKLFSIKGHNASVLYRPSLSELRTLNIYFDPSWSAKTMNQIPSQALYSLTTASLSCYKYKPGVEIIRPLFLASQATLTRLEIFINNDTAPIWQELLPLVASRIERLGVMIETNLPPSVLPVLGTFSSLDAFHFHNFGTTTSHHLQALLFALPSFKVLHLEPDRLMTAEVILEALRQPSTVALEKSQMIGGTARGQNSTPQSVLDECTRRGIAHELVDRGVVW